MLAFTFPGQGSQRAGMGAAWVDHPSWELVAHASETVDRDVAELLLDLDQETLTETGNAQLATFVTSLVVLDAAERLGILPTVCAGHSLGEYTALVASGALSYEDGLRLVAERGAAMSAAAEQEAGSMIAVLGLGDDDVEAACHRSEGDVWVANYNAPSQVVIAGRPDGLSRASEIARSLGAKRVIDLPVGGAFHTPLMAPARDRLRKVLQTMTFHVADPVVVANVDARPHPDPQDWSSLLSAQLCSPVRWRQTLEQLYERGARSFVELGPGGVLSGLAKRTLRDGDVVSFSVSTPADLEQLVERLAGTVAPARGPARSGDRYEMTERLVIAPATGPFTPVEALAASGPELRAVGRSPAGTESVEAVPSGPTGPGPTGPGPPTAQRLLLAVGDLVGWAGTVEIRTPFAGTLEGLLVLAGERVVSGQPVAWLRATTEAPLTDAADGPVVGSGTMR